MQPSCKTEINEHVRDLIDPGWRDRKAKRDRAYMDLVPVREPLPAAEYTRIVTSGDPAGDPPMTCTVGERRDGSVDVLGFWPLMKRVPKG